MRIHLKKSKCDQFEKGADVILGCTDNTLCPVSAILHYIASRGPKPGPFFLDSDGRVVIKAWFVSQIRTVLSSIASMPGTVFALVLLPPQLWLEWRTPQFRHY